MVIADAESVLNVAIACRAACVERRTASRASCLGSTGTSAVGFSVRSASSLSAKASRHAAEQKFVLFDELLDHRGAAPAPVGVCFKQLMQTSVTSIPPRAAMVCMEEAL